MPETSKTPSKVLPLPGVPMALAITETKPAWVPMPLRLLPTTLSGATMLPVALVAPKMPLPLFPLTMPIRLRLTMLLAPSIRIPSPSLSQMRGAEGNVAPRDDANRAASRGGLGLKRNMLVGNVLRSSVVRASVPTSRL